MREGYRLFRANTSRIWLIGWRDTLSSEILLQEERLLDLAEDILIDVRRGAHGFFLAASTVRTSGGYVLHDAHSDAHAILGDWFNECGSLLIFGASNSRHAHDLCVAGGLRDDKTSSPVRRLDRVAVALECADDGGETLFQAGVELTSLKSLKLDGRDLRVLCTEHAIDGDTAGEGKRNGAGSNEGF